MKFRFAIIAVAATAILFAACDEDTGSMGIIIDNDAITSTTASYQIYSRTTSIDSVVANTTKSYIGQVYDPETEALVKAEFVAQFHTFEDYKLPDVSTIVKNSAGEIEADSVELRLYFSSFFHFQVLLFLLTGTLNHFRMQDCPQNLFIIVFSGFQLLLKVPDFHPDPD